MKKQLTAHEKKVELAKASAPQYGIYFDGGSIKALIDAIGHLDSILTTVLHSDSEEKTKREAIQLIKESTPSVNYATVSNVSINMGK